MSEEEDKKLKEGDEETGEANPDILDAAFSDADIDTEDADIRVSVSVSMSEEEDGAPDAAYDDRDTSW